jgi:hypothetical protein
MRAQIKDVPYDNNEWLSGENYEAQIINIQPVNIENNVSPITKLQKNIPF